MLNKSIYMYDEACKWFRFSFKLCSQLIFTVSADYKTVYLCSRTQRLDIMHHILTVVILVGLKFISHNGIQQV